MSPRTRAVAIVIHQNKILLMHRINNGHEYYVFPGGGVEPNETIENAVLREVLEETTLNVTINKLLYHHDYYQDGNQYFYLCNYVSGEPQLSQNSDEKLKMTKDDKNFYQPLWIPINQLNQMLLYPLEIKDWLITDVKNNFIHTPKEQKLTLDQLRHTL